MKLALVEHNGARWIGVVTGDALALAMRGASMTDVIAHWPRDKAVAEAALQKGDRLALAKSKLLPPIPRPGKIFAIGLNYADHIAESKMETPPHQVWFTKAATSTNGPFDPILIAKAGPLVDYEVELVAVIGKRGRNIAKAEAASHIFGYCVGNDVTERMWQHRTPQWSLGKSFDTHAPIGPWITTADEVADPHALGLRCFVNGEKRQDSNTRHLVFNIWDQIEHLSQAMTLEPGDLIFTGTPGGVGAAMNPRQFLKAGDVVRCEIDGLGAIEAPLTAEAA
ncbi:MAG: fumarylacetoacetate hydrolase family protein [Alphaproteobacteria bacterium]|nr:fumarylacetoacetate hydrolase family protein [Alphaproteobacteria bacterium]MBV9540512.1 fumarylacetoacetate hydrolase family protein [Alphaproteobacteria bacterium]MBV9903789.1 fumarylacetoacetate hydrolase family protein [Alphaproteobacteria bacterium]